MTIGNTDARKMGTYSCTYHLDVVRCCAIDLDTMKTWCTYCKNTSPPSGCIPAGEESPKGNKNTNPKNGGGMRSNDESSNSGGSNTVDPDKIIEGGTFNDGSGSSSSDGSNGGIDSSKINSGTVFNQ